ncbi:Mth938-like domain-containing protein [Lysobacter korlensis]|uniref:Mth938-like domain-containing protein n=1 Tax=Lysobacter korlensis TaxID=553636 RepID=A0ABV6RK94_9GAMM
MQLTLEPADHEFVLKGADGSSARINEQHLTTSFVISPGALVTEWPVTDAAAIGPDELQPLLSLNPEVVLLGSGARQVFPPAATMAACLGRGIGIEVMTNGAAARTFSVLAGEGRRVVAGFILQPPAP